MDLLPQPHHPQHPQQQPVGHPAAEGAPAPALPPSHHDPEFLPPLERHTYDLFFQEAAGGTNLQGYVHGKAVVDLMSRSGLPKPQLRAIWALCDPEGRGVLYRPHFHLCLRLMALTQHGYIEPSDPTLPGRIRARDPLSVSLPQLAPLRMAPAAPTAVLEPPAMPAPVTGTVQYAANPVPAPPTSSSPPRVVVADPHQQPPPVHKPVVLSDNVTDRMAALDAVVEEHEWDDFQEAAAPAPPPPAPPSPPPAPALSPVAAVAALPMEPLTAPDWGMTPSPTFAAPQVSKPTAAPVSSLLDGGDFVVDVDPSPSAFSSPFATATAPAPASFLANSKPTPFGVYATTPLSGSPPLSSLSTLSTNHVAQVPTSRFMTETPPSSPPLVAMDGSFGNGSLNTAPSLGVMAFSAASGASIYEESPYADPDASAAPPVASSSTSSSLPVPSTLFDHLPTAAAASVPTHHSPFSPPPLSSSPPPLHKAYSLANPFQVHEDVSAGAASFSSFTTTAVTAAPAASPAVAISTTTTSAVAGVALAPPKEEEEEDDWDEFQGGGDTNPAPAFAAVLSQPSHKEAEATAEVDPFAGLKEDDDDGSDAVEEARAVPPLVFAPAAVKEEDALAELPTSPIQQEEILPSSTTSAVSSSSCPRVLLEDQDQPPLAGKDKEETEDEWGDFAEPPPTAAGPPAVPPPSLAPVPPTHASWAQANPWQDPNPWAAPIPTPTTHPGSTLANEPSVTVSPRFSPSPPPMPLGTAAATSSAVSVLLSPLAKLSVVGSDEEGAQASSVEVEASLESLVATLWEREMWEEAVALTDHLEAGATLGEERARYDRAKGEDRLEEAIHLRIKIKELEDHVCGEATLQAWRAAVRVPAAQETQQNASAAVTLSTLQARVGAVDAGRGEAFAAAFLENQPSLALQASSGGAQCRRDAVRRARRARRCCALLEGMIAEGGAYLAYPEIWLRVMAAAQAHVREAVDACRNMLQATAETAAVRKEVVTSLRVLSVVEAALEMVRVARLVLVSAADALLGLVLEEKDGLEASVRELQAVLVDMGLHAHFQPLFPPSFEEMRDLVADCAEAGALAVDPRAVCNLCLVPLVCARRVGVTVTYYSGHAYFCPCINLWINTVSRDAPQPQLQKGPTSSEMDDDRFF